jgi:hypothetical protein
MTSPYWTVMNDLSNSITNYLTVSTLLKDNLEDPQIVETAATLLDYYVDKQDKLFTKAWDVVVRDGASNMTEETKDQVYKNYRASIVEYNKLNDKYKALADAHEELQDLFYRVDGELDELKCKQCAKTNTRTKV